MVEIIKPIYETHNLELKIFEYVLPIEGENIKDFSNPKSGLIRVIFKKKEIDSNEASKYENINLQTMKGNANLINYDSNDPTLQAFIANSGIYQPKKSSIFQIANKIWSPFKKKLKEEEKNQKIDIIVKDNLYLESPGEILNSKLNSETSRLQIGRGLVDIMGNQNDIYFPIEDNYISNFEGEINIYNGKLAYVHNSENSVNLITLTDEQGKNTIQKINIDENFCHLIKNPKANIFIANIGIGEKYKQPNGQYISQYNLQITARKI